MTGHLVTVEPDGAVLRGLAVPFRQTAYFVDNDDKLVAEQFDEQSIHELPTDIPLLVGHDRNRPPAGIVTATGITSYGLGIEGRLIGSDDEIEGWRRKFAAGLMAALSIGFTAQGKQDWRRPERRWAPHWSSAATSRSPKSAW